MCLPDTIAIDGPAASGKSTLGLRLAESLNYLFFDTGVMYRAVTWAALDRGLRVDEEETISRLAELVDIDVRSATKADGRSADILIDQQDVTWEIRLPEVDAEVSAVSAYARVRKALTEQQRLIARRGPVVMVGRDIGTAVLPDADLKIYLIASVEERARRRYEERLERGELADYDAILSAMRRRDEYDSSRAVAPLRPAEDAIIVNSDGLDADQVLDQVIQIVRSQEASTCC